MTGRIGPTLGMMALAGCLMASPAAAVDVQRIEDAPKWGMVVDERGASTVAEIGGHGPVVLVSGAPDFDGAIDAMVRFCAARGVRVGTDWDTDFVYRDPAGAFWFSEVC